MNDSKLCQLVLARTFKDVAISFANDAPALAEVVTEVLERGRNKSTASDNTLNLDDIPTPAGLVDASGRLIRVNGAMEIFLGGPREHPGSVPLDDLLVSAEDVARWQNFRANLSANTFARKRAPTTGDSTGR